MTTLALPTVAGTRMVLVRHGEPEEGMRGRCYGRLDVGLSAEGREQARRTARFLSDLPIAAVYSSPRCRAVESANLLAAGRTPVTVDERLREIDFGIFEGLTYKEIARRFPDTYEEWMTHPTNVAFPGGETFPAMVGRVRDAVDELRRVHPDQTIAVVSHGGVNRIALATALDLDLRRIFRLAQAYACVNVIDYFPGEAVVRLVNCAVNCAVNGAATTLRHQRC